MEPFDGYYVSVAFVLGAVLGSFLNVVIYRLPLGKSIVRPASSCPGCSKRVVLYNANSCPYCRQVRAILARNKIRYSIRDATTGKVQAEMIRRFGDTAVPRTVIGGVVVNGVDEARIKRLCR